MGAMTDSRPQRLGRAAAWQPLVLAASLGLLHAASFAPWGYWWVQLAVLWAFAALIQSMMRAGRSPRLVGLAGTAFGFAWFVAGVGWLFVSMHTYGLMPAPLALLALVLFAIYLGLFPGAAAWATAVLCRSHPAGQASPTAWFALIFAAAFTLAELLRGHLFTGFPWLAVGYAQTDGPLSGFAALVGSYGVGFVACLIAGLLAGVLPGLRDGRPRNRLFARCLLPLAALLVAGQAAKQIAWSQPSGDPLNVRLLQGNVPQQMKFDPLVTRQTMQRYLELVEAEPADLIVLPETAWTVPWAATPPELAARLERFVRATGSAVALGLPLRTAAASAGSSGSTGGGNAAPAELALTNSVLLFDRPVFEAGAAPARYDKRHLVPFGEFVPWGFRWFVDLMTIPLGDFGRGGFDQAPFAVGSQRIAFNICYEDVFGEELLPALAGEDGATILANVSNIAWFGDSHALPQHLQIARMRTLETARPMIRATNTGVTAAIDFDGRLLGALPPYQLGALSVSIQGRSGLTPYARAGNWTVMAISLLILLAAALPTLPLAAGGKPAKIPR
jgi:apolipoprotein N-acyltransferase